jgi:hypothetical protein
MSARAAEGLTRVLPIGGKEITLTEELVLLSSVRLDPDNPRLRHRVRSKFNGRSPTQEELRDIVLELPSVDQLQADIRVTGGLIEPVYVTQDGLVVEGNCRTAVFMKLRESLKTEQRWNKIPVYRFPRSVSAGELAIFQAKHHITSGKKEWDAYEKANHIYHMHKELGMSVKAISESLHPRMHVDTINTHLETYSHFREGYLTGRDDGPDEERKAKVRRPSSPARPRSTSSRGTPSPKEKEATVRAWSYFHEFNKRGDLADFRKTAANKKRFAKLVKSGRLGPAMNVRKLASIINTPGALEVLEKQGIDEALKIVARYDPTAGSPLFKILADAVEALRKVPKSEIDGIRQQKKQHQIIRTLHSKLCALAEAAAIDLEE